jgi:hypothetical protein
MISWWLKVLGLSLLWERVLMVEAAFCCYRLRVFLFEQVCCMDKVELG